MNVANLELCKELYELSGWRTSLTENWYDYDGGFPPIDVATAVCPAYDLGYLLRKLPISVNTKWHLVLQEFQNNATGGNIWFASYVHINSSAVFESIESQKAFYMFEADNPEDAVAKLAIELFKKGILKRELYGGGDE